MFNVVITANGVVTGTIVVLVVNVADTEDVVVDTVVEPVYVVVVAVVVVVIVVVAVVDVVVVAVVAVDVVVSMHSSTLWFANGWCWPAGQGGHVRCVSSLGR